MAGRKPFELIVEGLGDVVQKQYVRTLKSLKERGRVRVTFVDSSEYWRGVDGLSSKHERFIASLPEWDGQYLDKSTEDGKKKYADLKGDIVFVATPDSTHVDVALHWLKPSDRCQRLFIEKPLDSSLEQARRFLGNIKVRDARVKVLDHYLARVHPLHEPLALKAIYGVLGGRIRGFNFYLLENGSGGPPHVGPLENTFRVQATRHGMILDLMPHMAAILSIFGLVETLRVTEVHVAQYTGVDGDPSKRSLIDKETFAHVSFGFQSHIHGSPFIHGHAYVGKGIRGSKALGIDGDVKLLDLEGINGKKLRCDLRSAGEGFSKAWFISKDGTRKLACNLTADPYDLFIRDAVQLLEDPSHTSQLALHVETAKGILIALEEMRWPIHPLKKEDIPTYHLGAGGNEAPYLEDVLPRLQPILPLV